MSQSQRVLLHLLYGAAAPVSKLKLAKLEYLVDFIHYAFHNSPASGDGVLYERRRYGPLARTFNADLNELASAKLIAMPQPSRVASAGAQQPEPVEPTVQKTLDYVLARYGGLSTSELLTLCHAQEPYLSACDGAIIEFFTAYNLIDDHQDYLAS